MITLRHKLEILQKCEDIILAARAKYGTQMGSPSFVMCEIVLRVSDQVAAKAPLYQIRAGIIDQRGKVRAWSREQWSWCDGQLAELAEICMDDDQRTEMDALVAELIESLGGR